MNPVNASSGLPQELDTCTDLKFRLNAFASPPVIPCICAVISGIMDPDPMWMCIGGAMLSGWVYGLATKGLRRVALSHANIPLSEPYVLPPCIKPVFFRSILPTMICGIGAGILRLLSEHKTIEGKSVAYFSLASLALGPIFAVGGAVRLGTNYVEDGWRSSDRLSRPLLPVQPDSSLSNV